MAKQPPRIRKSVVLYEEEYVQVVGDFLEFADGTEKFWTYARYPKGESAVRVCALTDKEELILVEEYRGAARRHILRLPAGFLEEGENPEAAAARELEEEVGLAPTETREFAVLEPTGGSFRELREHLVLARGLKAGSLKREPGEQDMEVRFIPLHEAYDMAERVEIEEPQTLRGILTLKNELHAG